MPEIRPTGARSAGACSAGAWSFSRVEELWERLEPLTPMGKDAKEERRVLGDRAAIEALYDDCDATMAFLKGAPGPDLDRLSYHLKRSPRLPSLGGRLEIIELFLVKKFLVNYRAARSFLSGDLRARFGLRFSSARLAEEFEAGEVEAESFHIADSFHPELPAVRASIAELDGRLASLRSRAAAEALSARGLDFAGRDFLVLPHEEALGLLSPSRAGGAPGPAFSVEAYDGRSCLVRMLAGEGELLAQEERDSLLEAERSLEEAVAERLSVAVAEEAANLEAYSRALRDFDLSRARARLAIELGLIRPRFGRRAYERGGAQTRDGAQTRGGAQTRDGGDDLGGAGLLELDAGRFLPCERECREARLTYTPLDARMDAGAAVVFGSNMGGKTVALQTLLFFQILAQAGLYVPARGYATEVYARLDAVGAPLESPQGGLSSFGLEIRSFEEAWECASREGAFLVLDEFAATTSSTEAEAILSAAAEGLSGLPRTKSLFATHFRGMARSPGVRYFSMRGLDRGAAASALGGDEPLADRIRRINRAMRYELVPAEEDPGGDSDAIAIASLLGLDGGLVVRAREFHDMRNQNAGGRPRGGSR